LPMLQGIRERAQMDSPRGHGISKSLVWLVTFVVAWFAGSVLWAQMEERLIDDITAKYQFLSADDTLAILDEEGKLNGYIDVAQPEEESEDVLTFNLVDGTRKKTHVEFRTNKIHGKSYRFSGNVERGTGHKDGDPDYLRLVGNLEIVTSRGDTGQEAVQVMRVLWKSFGKSEREDN
jgi:hypothetical protein